MKISTHCFSKMSDVDNDDGPTQTRSSGGGGKKKSGIPVNEYTRSDGTKVSNHKRSAPSSSSDQQEDEEGKAKDEGASEAKRPAMTLEEFLSQPWVEKVSRQINGDKDKAALADKDAAAAKEYHDRETARATAQAKGPLGGFKEFKAAFDRALKETGYTNEKGMAVRKQLDDGMYHDDGGAIHTRVLVPHLGDAGLNELANDVMNMKYTF